MIEGMTKEDHVAACLPAVGKEISDSCCKNYTAAFETAGIEGVSPYRSYARSHIDILVILHRSEGLSIPDSRNQVIFHKSIFDFLDQYCAANPEVAFLGAVSEFWRQVPKPLDPNDDPSGVRITIN